MNELINDAESNVIGGLLLFPDEFSGEVDSLVVSDFSIEPYQQIFEVISRLHKESKPFDLAIVGTQFKDRNELRAIAATCCEMFISPSNFTSYVQILKKQSQWRRINNKLSLFLYEQPENPVQELEKIAESEKEPNPKSGMAKQVMKYAEQLYHPEREVKFYTGFSRLDRALQGLKAGTLSYLGACPSAGKTSFALNVVMNQIRNRKKTLFFSLEMGNEQIFDRILSNTCNLDYGRINVKQLEEQERNTMIQTLGKIHESKLLEVIDDVYNVEDMPRIIAQYQPELVVVDYMQIIRSIRRFPNRKGEVDYISSELKRIAKRYKCHVLCLSQIARRGMDAPKMSDLKESGNLEADGDYIMVLHRPYVLNKENPDIRPEETHIFLCIAYLPFSFFVWVEIPKGFKKLIRTVFLFCLVLFI